MNGVIVTVTSPVSHLCPFRDEVDHGTIEITWDTGLIKHELHTVARLITEFHNQKLTHEDLTTSLSAMLGPCRVVGHWLTAGLQVTTEVDNR